ncbi:MAG: YceI family protein [Cyclobacteriaceae bacterium]|nr:YceI family protein [Cyclobacteriaceae bacterium]
MQERNEASDGCLFQPSSCQTPLQPVFEIASITRIWLLFILALSVHDTWAQKFVLEKSKVTFFSRAAIEDIKAENVKAAGIYDYTTGDVAFVIPSNGFEFENATMQEHFNEKYMESDKFPKATFQGKFSSFQPDRPETQPVQATGKLTIHGVTREVAIPGTIQATSQRLLAKATFMIKLADYNIKIPQLLWQKIAEQVEVTVEFSYKPQ